jgi:NSS family neurotransmitter:Na+ symporter
MMCELSVGRASQKAPYLAFSSVGANPVWNVIGWAGIITGGFLVLSYYNVVGGWTLKYMYESLAGLMTIAGNGESGQFFGEFISHKAEVVTYTVLFMACVMLIVGGGVGGGIERACKIMMPALFLILIVLITRSMSLPGSEAGVKFYLEPDFSKLTRKSFLDALGQAFFSLTLGLGAMMTYGSYLKKDENLPSAAVYACGLDTLIALMAGLAIFPAVFAMGFEPGAGVGLTFITLPGVFAKMPYGTVFSFLFFLLLFFAAITSAMSLLEAAVAFSMEKFKMTRKDAVLVMGIMIILMGGYSAISLSGDPKVFAPWAGKTLDFFDFVDEFCNNFMLPLGSLALCIFVGWAWLSPACKEVTNDGKLSFSWLGAWVWCVRVVAPAGIIVIFLNVLGIL